MDRQAGVRVLLVAMFSLALLLTTSLPWVDAGAVSTTATCMGKPATIMGTQQDDKLVGTPRNDVIVGLRGDDWIKGRAGDDIICGMGGVEYMRGGLGNDRLSGGNHSDYVYGQQGNDHLRGNANFDLLTGGMGNDTYDGGPGDRDQAIFAGSPVGVVVDHGLVGPQDTNQGIDTLIGIEQLWGSGFDDVLRARSVLGSGGFLVGSVGSDRLIGGVGDDSLFGGIGDDDLDGGAGSDRLEGDDPDAEGGPASDTIRGGEGNDVLIGGIGDDNLYGEAGDDSVNGGPHVTPGPSGGDLGHGGPNDSISPGDRCVEVERAVECETYSMRRRTLTNRGYRGARNADARTAPG
jgi:Ca2+-binding RTX toxin-like protein